LDFITHLSIKRFAQSARQAGINRPLDLSFVLRVHLDRLLINWHKLYVTIVFLDNFKISPQGLVACHVQRKRMPPVLAQYNVCHAYPAM
jgi:hypothetical protein